MAWDILKTKQHNDFLGINNTDLEKMIFYIYDCRDKLSKVLQDVEFVVQSTENFYQTEDGEEFRNRFKKFSSCFHVFLSNIKSYGEDLENVLVKYKQNDNQSIDIIKK